MDPFEFAPFITPAEEVLLAVVQRLTGLKEIEVARILAEAAVASSEKLSKQLLVSSADGKPEWSAGETADLVIAAIDAMKQQAPGVN